MYDIDISEINFKKSHDEMKMRIEKNNEKEYIKGALTGMIVMASLIVIMIIPAIIEMI